MLKKLLNFIKTNKEEKINKEEIELHIEQEIIEEKVIKSQEIIIQEDISNEPEEPEKIETIKCINQVAEEKKDDKKQNEEVHILTKEEQDYMKLVKIQRGKKIKAIDVYTNEEIIFDTHKECSKKLGVPIDYIKENLQYGYTDYYGEAVKFLSKKLRFDISSKKMGDKNINEIFNLLHNELWNSNMSESKREEILSSNKIEPISMYYKFETLDDEYDEYFKIYGKLIRRGGKKKIELIDKKHEVIDVFKSIDDCAKFFEKDKSEIIYRLKVGDCKVGRYEIKYSLRR